MARSLLFPCHDVPWTFIVRLTVLNAPTDATAAPRIGPRQPQPRDAKPLPAGFSSLIDDNAAPKSDTSRTRPTRDTEAGPSSATQKPRNSRDDAPRDADRASSSDETPRPEQQADKPGKADKAKDAPAIEPATEKPAPVAAIVDPTLVIAAAAPAEPVAVAVPVAVPPPVAAVVAAPPLAIAAAGIAAAKAAVAGTTDADEKADETAPTTAEVTAAPVKKAAPIEAAPVKIATGFAEPADAKTPEAAENAKPANITAKTEPEAASDAKPKDATITADAKPAPAHPAPAHEPSATARTAPSADINANGPQPVTPPMPPQSAAAVSPTAQLTATIATGAPVPLNGLAVELASRAQSGASRFDIRLDPAELGRIDVRIDIDRNGQVTSHLTVEKPETLAMLRQDSPQLQRALNDAGLKTADGALQFTLGDQSQPRQNADGGERQAQRFIIRDDETVAPAMSVRGYGRMPAARSGVDISV